MGYHDKITTYPHYVCLDSLIDLTGLDDMYLPICHQIAIADRTLCSPGPMITKQKFLREALHALEANDPSIPLEVRQHAQGLSGPSLLYYTAMAMPVAVSGEAVAIIDKYGQPMKNAPLFGFLLEWIAQRNVFVVPRKTTLFITPSGVADASHVDHDDFRPTFDDFVWFRLHPDKRLYIELENERVYPEGRAFWFNSNLYHSADACDHFTVSLRVDGTFTDDFKGKVAALTS